MKSKVKFYFMLILAVIIMGGLMNGCDGSGGSGRSGTGFLSGSGK